MGASARSPTVIVVGADRRTADAVRMGFERDGFAVLSTPEHGPEVVDE